MTVKEERKRKEVEDLVARKDKRKERKVEPKRYITNCGRSILSINLVGGKSLYLRPNERVSVRKSVLENQEIVDLLKLGKLRID